MTTPYEQFALGLPKDEVLCGLCEGHLEGPANPRDQDTLRCVRCGNGDTFDNIMRIAYQHFEETASEIIQGQLGDLARRNKSFTFKSNVIPKGRYCFIVSLKSKR